MNEPVNALRLPDPSLVNYTNLMYALHALSALIGIFTSTTVVGSFLFGIPSIVAVVMNYARRSDARGTYLESHFSWQLRTFWFAALAVAVGFLLNLPLFFVLVGFLTFAAWVVLVGVWIVYRVVRGWLKLKDGQAI
jgi:uncharacterized membrane protein